MMVAKEWIARGRGLEVCLSVLSIDLPSLELSLDRELEKE